MFDVSGFMEKALRQQRNLLRIYEQRLKKLPAGSLLISYSKGKAYYQKYNQGKRTYLGKKDKKEVHDLQARKTLEEMCERIKANEVLILDFLEKYQRPLPEDVKKTLGKAYQNDQLNLFSDSPQGNDKNWGDRPYRRNTAYPEQLTQKTLKGDYVRSKSEVIISNSYFAKSIPYRCEELIEVGNHIFAPDFAVWVERLKKVKYHEHFGMMHDPHYREKAFRKINEYIAAGFRPYEDILFTFDDLDGNIDAQILDTLIETFMK